MGKGTVGGLTFGKGSSVVFLLVVFSTALVVSLGAIAVAAALSGVVSLAGEGDLVLVVSGRNVDEGTFRTCLED